MDKLTSRKFILAMLLTVIFTCLIWFGKIGSDDYINAMMTLFGIYSGANVVTKFFSAKGGDKQ